MSDMARAAREDYLRYEKEMEIVERVAIQRQRDIDERDELIGRMGDEIDSRDAIIAQLEREIKNKNETIEQLRANNVTLASDAMALMTAKQIVFGDDATVDDMELFKKLRAWQAKAATLDKLETAIHGGKVYVYAVRGSYYLLSFGDEYLIQIPPGNGSVGVRSFDAALDALLGQSEIEEAQS